MNPMQKRLRLNFAHPRTSVPRKSSAAQFSFGGSSAVRSARSASPSLSLSLSSATRFFLCTDFCFRPSEAAAADGIANECFLVKLLRTYNATFPLYKILFV